MKSINLVEDLHKGIDLKELAQKPAGYQAPTEAKKEDETNDSNERHGE